VLMTADGPIVLAVGNDRQFGSLCEVLKVSELAEDPRFATNTARVAHRVELTALLESALATRSAKDWFADLTAAGVPCGPIQNVAEAFEMAENLGLNPIVSMADESGGVSRQVANPIGLSATPASYRMAPPALGSDTMLGGRR
jgi:crotonobetainyl-CoA:carnitine CoA-transferase CaiB-like acyl-CoA transferase